MITMDENFNDNNSAANSNSSSNDNATWKMFGHKVPRSEVVFICQMIIICGVIISCIVNLSLKNGNAEMWVSFFGYAFGAMLPPPKIKKSLGKAKSLTQSTNSFPGTPR